MNKNFVAAGVNETVTFRFNSATCDVCGKDMESARYKSWLAGLQVVGGIGDADEVTLQQYGVYDPNHTYSICVECLLRALGVPKPKKATNGADA